MRQPFCIAVCDDVTADREEITEMTQEICKERQIYSEISGFESADELLDNIKNSKQYDLLLLDVMMPEVNGIELAKVLRSQKDKISIVFVSGNREMALQGYEVEASRYLAKPLNKEKLQEAIAYCYAQSQKSRGLLLPADGSMRKVAPKDIFYVEIAGRKSKIHQEKEEWYASLPMGEMEEMLQRQGFIRCHQSFLVNCCHVRNFHTSSMELTDGRKIPVSKHRIKEVREAFFEYMNH